MKQPWVVQVLAVSLSLLWERVDGTQQPPNVVFILADDLGWNDVSFHGSRQIPTPNLDTLAYDGIQLKNYYVQPICTPTRSALLTGRYPVHTGMQHSVIVSSAAYGLGLNETLMSQYFREVGYSTHIVGKWHLGMHAREFTPLYRGFDSHFGYYQGCGDYYDHSYSNSGPLTPAQWGLDFRRDENVLHDEFGQYSTELFSNEAERIIEKHNTSKPLFLYLPHQAVHSGNPFTKTPLEAPWKYQEKVSHIKHPGRRMFAAMVSALDDAVGNVTRALHARGMLNNTIIVFSTDNGGPAAGFDFNFANNWPLRGLKSTLWEGGTRGSGFLWSPLLAKSGYTSELLVHVTDWLPTLLHPAGYAMGRLPRDLDGYDQWEVLSNDDEPRRTDFLYNIDPVHRSWAMRSNNMKLIFAEHGSTKQYDGWYRQEQGDYQLATDAAALMGESADSTEDLVEMYNMKVVDNERARHAFDSDRFNRQEESSAPEEMFTSKSLEKILKELGRDSKPKGKPVVVECGYRPANYTTNCDVSKAPCLFDIASDPCELNNIADQFPDVVKHLLSRVKQYSRTMVPPRNKPVDPKGFPCYHDGVWVPWINLTETERSSIKT